MRASLTVTDSRVKVVLQLAATPCKSNWKALLAGAGLGVIDRVGVVCAPSAAARPRARRMGRVKVRAIMVFLLAGFLSMLSGSSLIRIPHRTMGRKRCVHAGE